MTIMKRFQTTNLLTCSALLCLTGGLAQAAPVTTTACLASPVLEVDEEQPTPELRGILFANDGGSIACDFLVGDDDVFIRFDHALDTETEGRIYCNGMLIEFDSASEATLFGIFDRFLESALTDEEQQDIADGTRGTADFDTQSKKEAAMFYSLYLGYQNLMAAETE